MKNVPPIQDRVVAMHSFTLLFESECVCDLNLSHCNSLGLFTKAKKTYLY